MTHESFRRPYHRSDGDDDDEDDDDVDDDDGKSMHEMIGMNKGERRVGEVRDSMVLGEGERQMAMRRMRATGGKEVKRRDAEVT